MNQPSILKLPSKNYDASLVTLAAAAQDAGTVNGTGIDLGSADAAKSGDKFFVSDIINSNGGSVVYTIADSADNSSFSTIATFPSYNANGEKYLPIPPHARRYVRVTAVVSTATLTHQVYLSPNLK